MKILGIVWVLFLLPFTEQPTHKELSGIHKFYVSVTRIEHQKESDALQITTRIFIDDLEKLLSERYGIEGGLATESENPLADEYILKYLRAKFLIRLDENPLTYKFLGKRYEYDQVILYMEVPESGLNQASSISVECDLLTDLFEEQKNIVHVLAKGKKKSFVLIQGNDKGMLKLP